MTKVNFSPEDRELPEGGPPPIGVYPCRITANNLKHLDGGKELWELTFEIMEGDCKGRTFWDDIFWSKKALPRAFHFLSAALADCDAENPEGVQAYIDSKTAELDTEDTSLVVGRRLMVKIGHEEFEHKGQQRTKAKVEFRGYAPLGVMPEGDDAGDVKDEALPF